MYRHYLLFVLMLVFVSNGVDRIALGLVLQDIKIDLDLSDTQLGLLTGLAFALFYSVMGLPIARWADRGDRITIVTVTTVLWSGAVALCGLASGFLQLLLIRVGVAVGEAGCLPPAHSLIADNFSREERPRATSIYMLGAPLSTVLGYFAAGWLNEFFGWRTMFIVLGLPGIALALMVRLTLRDPREIRQSDNPAVVDSAHDERIQTQPTVRVVLSALWGRRTFRTLLLFFVVAAFFAAGLAQWKPAFFIRTYGLRTGELGTWFAAVYGIGGIVGTILGGMLASRYAANDERRQLKFAALLYCLMGAVLTATFLAPNAHLAFGLLALSTIMNGMTNGPLFATIQSIVPERMRAVSIALLFLFANLVGLGLGPLAAGLLSDVLHPAFGEGSLRYALLLLCPGTLWCAWCLWRASRTVTEDMAETTVPETRLGNL